MSDPKPIFRFAPSPNGELHIGHAFSALLNLKLARRLGGKMLLRIEDIDRARCTPENEKKMLEDLEWIGFEWDYPPRRQSEHFDEYKTALGQLIGSGLVFPSTLSRSEIRNLAYSSGTPKTDPDGALIYPGNEHALSEEDRVAIFESDQPFALRFDVEKVFRNESISWREITIGQVSEDPRKWGKPIIARKDTPSSYHLSCVVDDTIQGVSHIVRGTDLYHATSIHTLLQISLNLPQPRYHHHALVLDETGQKLSKSKKDTSLRQLRDAGHTVEEVISPLIPLLENDKFYQNCTQEKANHHTSNNN